MYAVALLFLVWAWKGVKKTLPRSFIALIAIISAVTIVVQLVEFPVAGGGSTWHFLGGTTISMILGPYATVISMTITLIIQALGFGDGGITSFGANVFNMAVIGALSFFLVKVLLGKNYNDRRLVLSVFVASWVSNIMTALAVGIEIGIYPMAGQLGGLIVTVPSMLMWYVPTGLIEGLVAAALIIPLSRIKSMKLLGLDLLRTKEKDM
jgi:cobalt/nickel transport system permease protein